MANCMPGLIPLPLSGSLCPLPRPLSDIKRLVTQGHSNRMLSKQYHPPPFSFQDEKMNRALREEAVAAVRRAGGPVRWP